MYFHIMNMSFYLMFLSLITFNSLKVIDVTKAAQKNSYNQISIHSMIMENSDSQDQANVTNWIH